MWHGQGEWLSRLALVACPLLGATLVVAGVNRSRAAHNLGVLVGVAILGYVAVKVAWSLLMTTGLGLWLVLGGAVAAVVVGAGAPRSGDE